ncbi:hypothetical protein ACFQ5Q_15425 [Luteolibacter ambystomatis]
MTTKWMAVIVAALGAVACSNQNAPSQQPGAAAPARNPNSRSVSVTGSFVKDGWVLVDIANQGKQPVKVQTAPPAVIYTAFNGRKERWVNAAEYRQGHAASPSAGTEEIAPGQGKRILLNPQTYVSAEGGAPVKSYNPKSGTYAVEIEVNGRKSVRPVQAKP